MEQNNIFNCDNLRPDETTVAGHDGTLCDEDEIFFCKPCTRQELTFYNSAQETELATIMPLYFGGLREVKPRKLEAAQRGKFTRFDPDDLEEDDSSSGDDDDAGQTEPTKEQTQTAVLEQVTPAPASEPVPQDGEPLSRNGKRPRETEVLEQASSAPDWIPSNGKKIKSELLLTLAHAAYRFKKANILDVKLGHRLYADDAPAAKKARFDKITSETTHDKFGFRTSGMRVYRGSEDEGRLDKNGFLIYDKDYGRLTINENNIEEGFRNFIFNPAAGIDEPLGKAVCAAFAHKIGEALEVLERCEMRLYSSSLLFVFEGDGESLRRNIEKNNKAVDAVEKRTEKFEELEKLANLENPEKLENRTTLRNDSGIAMGDDDELIMTLSGGRDDSDDDEDENENTEDDEDAEEEDKEEEEEEEDDDDAMLLPELQNLIQDKIQLMQVADAHKVEMLRRSDEHFNNKNPILRLYMIDFAHAEWKPQQGPDENVLFGVRKLREIFEKMAK